jgi:kynurenine formamidase
MIIIENLTNLEQINEEVFDLMVLPLKIKEADGSPIRAIATVE